MSDYFMLLPLLDSYLVCGCHGYTLQIPFGVLTVNWSLLCIVFSGPQHWVFGILMSY